MISKAKSKFIKSLQIKKYRKQEQCFVVEGEKSIRELLQSDFEIILLVLTPDFLDGINSNIPKGVEIIESGVRELNGLGYFQSNETGIAIARMKPNLPLKPGSDEFGLVLDDLRDPGNLGTIIRTADWYGVRKVIASQETADIYNSKVIQATMGSFTRVQVFYTDIVSYLASFSGPVFGTFLDGENVHDVRFDNNGLIVIGNEANGISYDVEQQITRRITIPRYGKAESLNAGVAAAIVLDSIMRRK